MTTAAIADLFPETKLHKARSPRRKLMHVADAYESDGAPICRMFCQTCKTESDWMEFSSVTEAKRGIPCPKCNQPTAT